MTYLVTGGSGFIGSYVCMELLKQNEKVVAVDYINHNVLQKIFTPEQREEIVIVDADFSDLSQVSRIMIDYKIDNIIHLGSWLHPYCNENPGKCAVRSNIMGQQVMLEAARIFNVRKFVWASTSVVFGPVEKQKIIPVPNDAPHNHVNVYGASKSFCEVMTLNYDKNWGIDTLGLRYTIVYGPGRERGASRFFNNAIMNVATGKPAVIKHSDDIIDWQFVKDIAKLTVKASKVGRTKTRIFNTKCDVRKVTDGVEYLRKFFPNADIKLEPGKFGVAWDCDDSKLQEEIGFTPEFDMKKGILEVINFARKEADLSPLSIYERL